MTTTRRLTFHRVNSQVCRVLSARGEHVGNLKLIGAVWKFKAMGYDADGSVIPGGGPLTDQHNLTFAALDEAQVNAVLAPVPEQARWPGATDTKK